MMAKPQAFLCGDKSEKTGDIAGRAVDPDPNQPIGLGHRQRLEYVRHVIRRSDASAGELRGIKGDLCRGR